MKWCPYLHDNISELKSEVTVPVGYNNTEIEGTEQDVLCSDISPSRVMYCNAPLIFHVVRMDIGDTKWQSFIRKLYSDNYGRGIGYDDFKRTLEHYANTTVIEQMEKNINSKGIPDKIVNK